jgi:parallel beta-helix repeat protein
MRLAVAAVAAAAAVTAVIPILAEAGGPSPVPPRHPAIDVHPSPSAITKALRRAEPGDLIRVHEGHYRESLLIDKRVRIVGAPGEPRPIIDGRCRTQHTIAVLSPGVLLRRLKVVGADEGFGPFPSEVNFGGVGSGRATKLFVRDTCDAEYGINVFQSGEIELANNRASGFSDAGIYVGAIDNTRNGQLYLRANVARANNKGIIVEDSAGGSIALRRNDVRGNRAPGEGTPTGIWIHDSDGVILNSNSVTGNGEYGLHLTAGSDSNVLYDNVIRRNPTNLLDEGSGNCGSGNRIGEAGNVFPAC